MVKIPSLAVAGHNGQIFPILVFPLQFFHLIISKIGFHVWNVLIFVHFMQFMHLKRNENFKKYSLVARWPRWLAVFVFSPAFWFYYLCWFVDSHLNLNSHTSSICKSAFYHICALRHIRGTLTDDMAKAVAVSLVQSRLDYANSILRSTSKTNLNKLQRVQNTLARIVLNKPARPPSEGLLSQLYWLPIEHRIKFKLATLTYKARHCICLRCSILISLLALSALLTNNSWPNLIAPLTLASVFSVMRLCSCGKKIPLETRAAPSIESLTNEN